MIHCSAKDDYNIDKESYHSLTISSDGSISRYFPTIYKSSCKLDVRNFPFDDQVTALDDYWTAIYHFQRFMITPRARGSRKEQMILSSTPLASLSQFASQKHVWGLGSSFSLDLQKRTTLQSQPDHNCRRLNWPPHDEMVIHRRLLFSCIPSGFPSNFLSVIYTPGRVEKCCWRVLPFI